MSQNRQLESIVVRTLSVRYSAGYAIPEHAHAWHQLIYASEGVMRVHAGSDSWVVPPGRAVWVPAGVEHSVEMCGAVALRTLYFARDMGIEPLSRCCVVSVSPLMRELILHAVRVGMLGSDLAGEMRLAGVLLDQIQTLPTLPLRLPMPSDPRASRVAEHLLHTFADNESGDALAALAGTSRRTLERLFRKDTGMTLGQWRHHMRLIEAVRLLASGTGVTEVAWSVGYDSLSAFIAAFRQTFGVTPGQYFDGRVGA